MTGDDSWYEAAFVAPTTIAASYQAASSASPCSFPAAVCACVQ